MQKPYTIHNGNSLEVLKGLEENSIDSIVTDPPYELGFMGKKWDSTGIAYNVELWEECLRVLKPGGHLLAFSGSRTYHRMAVAIEDAGFEVRDQIMWVYGCLSEDTQIVTPFGNKSYTEIKPNDLVLCYDKETNEYSYKEVEDIYEYDIKDTAYRIQSDFTDQIVSRNHRCIVERNGREVFEFAENLSPKENIPFLENLSELQDTFSYILQISSTPKQKLLKGLFKQSNWKGKYEKFARRGTSWENEAYMQSMWSSVLQKYKTFAESKISSLFLQMQWQIAWGGVNKTFTQRSKWMDRSIYGKLSQENEWREQSIVERWRNLSQKTWKSSWGKICKMSDKIFTDGEKRWLCYGTSINSSTTSEQKFEKNRSGSSYKSQFIRQSFRKFNAIFNKSRTQTLRGWEGHKTTMATITPIEYEGKIWCVKVPTGAFVAVRNGMAFVTGNSGFPKSHDISKAIDKMAGAEREILGRNPNTRECVNDIFEMKGSNKITAPATEEAKQWEGWGTQIKPAHEPICLARKPIIGTIAENVLEWGTGGINIGGCRVGNEDTRQKIGGKAFGIINDDGWKPDENRIGGSAFGRFPANFIHDGSDEVLERFPDTAPSKAANRGLQHSNRHGGLADIGGNLKEGTDTIRGHNDNGGSAARFFYCAKASKRDRNEGIENTQNNHPTVKPTDLMQYLCRLITPLNGLIIDPFMGSGSTGKAAMYEGFRFIGIDLDPEYCKIAEARIEFALNKSNVKEEKKPKGVKSSKQTSSDNTDNSSSPLW